MSMCCFDCHDYMDGFNRGKKEGTIEELEKIKTEFENRLILTTPVAIHILNKRISELKGESNGTHNDLIE